MPYKHSDASFLDRKLKTQNKSPFRVSTVILPRELIKELFHCHDILKVMDPNAGVNFLLAYTPLRGQTIFLWWPFLILVGNPHCFDEVSAVVI